MRTRHVLPDGVAVVVRPIEAADKAELQAGLGRLSPETVQRRFLAPKNRFSKSELRYLTEVDGHDHVAFVAEREVEPGTIVAVARYVRSLEDPTTAEAAIVVADFLQQRGLGTVLSDALAAEAERQGVRRFTATTLGENEAAHRLMGHLAGTLARHHDGAGHAELAADLAA